MLELTKPDTETISTRDAVVKIILLHHTGEIVHEHEGEPVGYPAFCPEERALEIESTVCLSGGIVVGIAALGISVKFDAVGEFFFPVN